VVSDTANAVNGAAPGLRSGLRRVRLTHHGVRHHDVVSDAANAANAANAAYAVIVLRP
jgi:hypothetical protein